MSIFGWGDSVDKAVDIVSGAAETGLKIWDNSNFTAQEQSKLYMDILAATKSQATSISRRHLLWFIMSMTGFTLILAVIYNALGWDARLEGLIEIMEAWKIGWAFVSTVSFYYLTQFSGGSRK